MESKCEYGCNYCFPTTNRSCTKTWFRSIKRKLHELELETQSFLIPGLPVPQVARVNIENECSALREMVSTQQNSINLLAVELEEERNASSSAANEAMSMILRLQREKASIEMEARQFKRFAEQKSSHDQQEIAALEELLYKREQTIQSLTCEVQAYKYRMMSYGLTQAEAEGVKGVITHSNSIGTNSDTQSIQFDDYPPLKCHTNEQQMYPDEAETEIIDIDKYAFSETQTPCSIKNIEHRINKLERSPRHQPVLEKVIVGHSPRKQKPSTRFSSDSMGSFFATIKEEDSNLKKVENGSEFGSEMSGDRIYTVDSIHYNAPAPAPATYYNDQKASININNTYDDCISAIKDSVFRNEIQDPEVMKLYARLHALEADRESMRQAIINMRTDKAQLVLLKEIAQNLCKDHMSATSRMPAKKKSYFKTFGQTVVSFVLWRRNANQTK
ncbi:myosin-binding protein 7-like [Bidens hawaiensis]|uniref:myosin-binding protein 7-like n=1 Tax=Bidens hawaiensis TaxID=980011 RepID=UPI004049D83A